MTDQTDAQVLAALEVLGWPDDREASAHIEPDGYEVTPARHYWDLVTDVLTAAEAARVPLVSLLPEGMTEAELIERFRVALEQPQRITVLPQSESDREQAAHARGVAEGRCQATEGYAVPEHLVGDGPCCQNCGTVNIRWYADSPLWNRVMGGPDARDDPGGIICIRCFVIRADAAGHDPSAWRLTLPGTSLAREWGIRRPLDGVCVPYADERTATDAAERTRRAARYGAASIVSRLVGPWEPTEQAEQTEPKCTCPMTDVTNIRETGEGIRTYMQGLDPACPTCVRANAEEADRG